MSSSIVSPFPFFTDTTGAPLEGGYIFIGQSNLNPETAPVNVFWDAALTIPAAQPVRTVGGYPSRQGTPSRFYSSTDTYSITVRNKNRALVFSAFDQTDAPSSVFDISTQLITATASQTTFSLTTFAYLPGTDTLQVFRNGLRLNLGLDYLETNSVTITLTAPAAVGDQFLFQGGAVITGDQTPGSAVSFIQAGAGAITRNMQDKVRESVSVKDFGAVGNGIADDTLKIQDAINSLASTGGIVEIPAGNYKITSTLTISRSGIFLQGSGSQSTKLTFTGLSSDCILFQGASQINGNGIKGVWISGSSLTGGHAINMQVVAYGVIEDVNIDNPWNGILCFQTNTITINRVVINLPRGSFACKWDSPTSNNSSALTLENVTMQGGYLGANGFVWDGFATSLRMKSVAILSFRDCFRIENTRNSSTAYPQFANIFGLEIDGASKNALVINAGFNFKFVGCDITNTSGATGQGSADTQCVVISPDASYSVTRFIDFTECQIGNCQQQGIFINAKDVKLTGCTVHDVSKQGVSSFSAIELGGSSTNITITGGKAGIVYGDALNCRHGVLIGTGVTNVAICGVDFQGTNLIGVQNNSSTPNTTTISGCNGFVSKSSGVSTLTAGSTSITVPHGVSATPVSVTVSPQQQLSGGTTFYGTISGANVLIGVSGAQAGNVDFCWSASLAFTN